MHAVYENIKFLFQTIFYGPHATKFAMSKNCSSISVDCMILMDIAKIVYLSFSLSFQSSMLTQGPFFWSSFLASSCSSFDLVFFLRFQGVFLYDSRWPGVSSPIFIRRTGQESPTWEARFLDVSAAMSRSSLA